ncbi:MAG: 1-acyl-sn-glycerol-3-phosphate acyltransferase [Gammaproteobacteria bacterium]|nr:1-acyl-sn-glycerol-3-phosphate acyltransferase [Gammaproteobacteria bacterium]
MLRSLKNLFLLPVIWLWLLVLCILLYVLSHLPRSFSGRYYHFLSRYWCGVFVRALDVDLRLVHKNLQPLPEQYILIANHPSALEDFGIPALFDIYPLAKEGVRNWIVLGRISDYAGTIYVKRGDAQSRHEALQSLVDAVKAGKNIVLFPEGGCKGRRIYEKFHTGAFDISLQTGVPILPVFLHYVDQETFEWTNQSLLLKLWQIFKSNKNLVNYYAYDAIKPDQFSDKKSFAKYTHSLYLEWQKDYLDD